MRLVLSEAVLQRIHLSAEQAYPEEAAGLLLGHLENGRKQVVEILPVTNAREDSARRNRYLLTPQDYLNGELKAARLGLEVVGVFHSHPDHPDRPSEYDREWALPVFSYLITSVVAGKAASSRSWLLGEDRQSFYEEPLEVIEETHG